MTTVHGGGMSSLLLITVDRLPAWILPPYGTTWVSTPALDGLAASGVVLDRLIASSLDPVRLLDETVGTLLADAAAAGERPALVTDEPSVAERHGGRGVETVVVPAPAAPRRAADVRRTALWRLFAAAHDALRAGHAPLWVHAASLGRVWDAPEELVEPHLDPLDPPPPLAAAAPTVAIGPDTDPDLVVGYRHVFAGQVSLLDRLIGSLVEATRAERGDRWSVCLVGIRGMPLGIHGFVGPPARQADEAPFGESVHLPAILADRAGRMAGQRHRGIVVPADVAATLRGFVGLAPDRPAATEGRSLVGLLDSWTHPGRERALCLTPGGTAVVTRDWHLIEFEERRCGEGTPAADRRPARLYAKPDDFFELCDVADRSPETVADLSAVAEAARAGLAPGPQPPHEPPGGARRLGG